MAASLDVDEPVVESACECGVASYIGTCNGMSSALCGPTMTMACSACVCACDPC